MRCFIGLTCAMRSQSESYVIDGKTVSNVVSRSTSPPSHDRGSHNDNPGGSINFFDPRLGDGGEATDFSAPDDTVARKRLDVKNSIGVGRGRRRRLMGGAAGV